MTSEHKDRFWLWETIGVVKILNKKNNIFMNNKVFVSCVPRSSFWVLNNLTNTREIQFDFLSNSITDKPCSRLLGLVNGLLGKSIGK